MRFAIYVPCYGDTYGDPAVLSSLAVEAEAAGWDGFFMWDHVVAQPLVADPWVTLGAVAARTSRIALGPMITPVPRRRPWKLALEASTLQRLSGGRLVLGVGMGVPRDFTSFGEASDARSRAARMTEGVEVVQKLLSGKPVEHRGEVYEVSGVQFAPVEVPVWTSGIWPRKVPFLAAAHASGLFPIIQDGSGGFAVASPEQAARMKADFVAAGGPADGDVAIWGGGVPEEAGWDGFFLWDHVVRPEETVLADVWVTLGAVAARTSSIRLGPMVTSLGRRRPWKLALEASTLQRLSGGRLVVGIGAGVPDDFVPFGEQMSRAGALSEGVGLLRALLSGEVVNHRGPLFRVEGVRFAPVDVPLWIGGNWPRSVPFRAAEHGAGVVPATFVDGELVVLSPGDAARMKADFVASGGPADCDVAIWGGSLPEEVKEYEDAGVTWMFTDGGAREVEELRAFVLAGPPRSGV